VPFELSPTDPWIVMDAALGTRVEALGFDVDNPLWGSAALLSDEGRDAVRAIHRDDVRAGAELLVANTHNASSASCRAFVERGFAQRAMAPGLPRAHPESDPAGRALLEWVNRAAVDTARAAAGPSVRIAACLMSPDRPYARAASLPAERVREELLEQAEILDALRLDLVIFEMLSTDADVSGAAQVIRTLRSPVGFGLTCGVDGATHGGVDPVRAARTLFDAGASIGFVQCTHHDAVLGPLERLVKASALPIGAYANDGRTLCDGVWRGTSIAPSDYAALAERWIEAGARAVGGCCGTGAGHVRALAALKAGLRTPNRS